MATIFLSYRRTDSPQACRVYNWLVRRFGNDSIFMDVTAIPFAVSFPDYIKQAIANSNVLIALIGTQWLTKIHQEDDSVRMEIEVAIASHVPVLPVLIGNTPMPNVEDLPASISTIASQNAMIVGVLHDFDLHMQLLLSKIESILGALALQNTVTSDSGVIYLACRGVIQFLSNKASETEPFTSGRLDWRIGNVTDSFSTELGTRLFLHRVIRLAELLELHFILSFFALDPAGGLMLAGWVLRELERNPLIPNEFFKLDGMVPECDLKIRRSDEDPRQIWKMITSDPLLLSLAYIATVSPKARD
jgi:hypothetical protein